MRIEGYYKSYKTSSRCVYNLDINSSIYFSDNFELFRSDI